MSEDTAVLDPPAPKLAIRIADQQYGFDKTYTIKTIPFFMKLELVALLGTILDDAMSGPGGLSVAALLQSLNEDADPDDAQTIEGLLGSFKDPDVFMQGMIKLLSQSSEHFEDIYCIMLAVSKDERPLVKMIMTRPEDEGGISDDEGIAIFENWMALNGDVVRDFFIKRIVSAWRRSRKAGSRASSNSSSPTPPTTPKA